MIRFTKNPMHPYTKALLSAAPMPDPNAQKRRILLTGDVPSPIRMIGEDDPAPDPRALKMEPDDDGVIRLGRDRLLDRPDLAPVPNDPGHFVSARDLPDEAA